MNQFHKYPLPVKFTAIYKESKSIELIKDFLNKNDNVMLSISFGKDSMTLLHLLYKYKLLNKIKVVMFNNSGFEANETLLLRDYVLSFYGITNYKETFVDNFIDFINRNDIINQQTKKSFIDFTYNVLEIPRWKLMDDYGINGTIIGLRKQESKGRKINFILRGFSYYNKRELSNILQPIANWTTEEIFRYAYSENIPIHPVYNRSKGKGFDFMRERVNTLIDIDYSNYCDRIEKMRILYPDDYKRIINQIPELRR